MTNLGELLEEARRTGHARGSAGVEALADPRTMRPIFNGDARPASRLEGARADGATSPAYTPDEGEDRSTASDFPAGSEHSSPAAGQDREETR